MDQSISKPTFGPAYYLEGGQAYIAGTLASSLGYPTSAKTFY
jgi:hypothetical protein